ncbi:MAG: cytochrome b5 domain-containing protein [Gammaproteobacteria bacterium]
MRTTTLSINEKLKRLKESPMNVITVEGERYEVTLYMEHHPGEGIKDIFLKNYKNKDVTEQFNLFHMTHRPWHLLEKARANQEASGIIYLGSVVKSEVVELKQKVII